MDKAAVDRAVVRNLHWVVSKSLFRVVNRAVKQDVQRLFTRSETHTPVLDSPWTILLAEEWADNMCIFVIQGSCRAHYEAVQHAAERAPPRPHRTLETYLAKISPQ